MFGWKTPHGLFLLVSSRFVPSDIHCVAPFVCLPNDHPAVPPSLSSRFIPSSCAYFSSFLICFSLVGLSGCRVQMRKKKSSDALSHMVIAPLKVFFVFLDGGGLVGGEGRARINEKKKVVYSAHKLMIPNQLPAPTFQLALSSAPSLETHLTQ